VTDPLAIPDALWDRVLDTADPLGTFDLDGLLDRVLDPDAHRPAPEPEPVGTFAEQATAQLSELEQGIKDRKRAERDRFRAATDSEYWFAVCFTSRAQKEEFLRAAGLWEAGDKYLDGRLVADRFGIELAGE
jgi:hypothetical protein